MKDSAYNGKKVFLTGITGFKGSWLALWLLKMGAEVKGYALPPETEINHYDLLKLPCETSLADIRDSERLQAEMKDFQPDIVFHLAAQSLVRRSYREPKDTYDVNVMGTLNLLASCQVFQPKAVVIITSDKVYENKEWEQPYVETDILGGYDLYSSSKACAEILTSSFQRSFFPLTEYDKKHQCLISTVRAGNVIGGGDWSEDRLIPDIVKATSKGESVEIRNPYSVRPWQHVLDPLSGYLKLGSHLLQGDIELAKPWNFGPSTESVKNVEEVLKTMQSHWTSINPSFPDKRHKLHEAQFLSVDSSQANAELKWFPRWNVNRAIELTTLWYKNFYEKGEILSEQQLDSYLSEKSQYDEV